MVLEYNSTHTHTHPHTMTSLSTTPYTKSLENAFDEIKNTLFYYVVKRISSKPINVRCLVQNQLGEMHRITMRDEILYIENLSTKSAKSTMTIQSLIDLQPKYIVIKFTGAQNSYDVVWNHKWFAQPEAPSSGTI